MLRWLAGRVGLPSESRERQHSGAAHDQSRRRGPSCRDPEEGMLWLWVSEKGVYGSVGLCLEYRYRTQSKVCMTVTRLCVTLRPLSLPPSSSGRRTRAAFLPPPPPTAFNRQPHPPHVSLSGGRSGRDPRDAG
eukprot:3934981-Rhodomonas_salina.1